MHIISDDDPVRLKHEVQIKSVEWTVNGKKKRKNKISFVSNCFPKTKKYKTKGIYISHLNMHLNTREGFLYFVCVFMRTINTETSLKQYSFSIVHIAFE
jgi:hypothetical protein